MKNIYVYILLLALGLMSIDVNASSHREAPLISNDPLADNVDLYAFRSPDNPDMITVIATYVPLQLPQGGPNYYNFGENIRYEIHVDNDAGAPGDEIIYRFTFNMVHEDPSTFFYIRLGKQNSKMTYTLERSMDGGATFENIVSDGYVPPNNIGPRSIESMVGLGTEYDNLFLDGITNSSTGERVFAGPTDDPFFVDLGGIFDLGNAPRQVGVPVDGLACMNVSALALQIPISTLLKAGSPSTPTSILDSDYIIGVWASASRPAVTTLSSTSDPSYSGDWVQVSRLGMPLTNEAVIPVGQKDFWNALSPYDEITETTLDEFFYNPELALYMDDDQFGGAVPAFSPLRIQTASLGAFDFTNGADGLFSLKGSAAVEGTALDDAIFGTLLLPEAGKPRSVDLWPAFHTGVPNLAPYQLATGKGGNPLAAGKPFVNNFLPNGGDMLRLNMAVPTTPRNDANFSSLGLLQAAVLGLTTAPYNTNAEVEFIPNMDGFPNGRRLEDDVTRIELQAVSGIVLAAIGLWYDDYDPMSGGSPVTQDLLNVLTYTTGVENNDKAFRNNFPYLAQPHSGTGDCSGREYVNPNDVKMAGKRTLLASSNNSGTGGFISLLEEGGLELTPFAVKANDADGIHFDDENDLMYQLNRSTNSIDVYSSVKANLSSGLLPTFEGSSTVNSSNGREITVSGNKLVVAQDAAGSNGDINAFVIYTIDGTTVEYDRTLETDINLWGIHLEGNTMYAIQDNSANLARYDNFFSRRPGVITADAIIVIEDMIRTHGLAYDNDNDMMALTDVGEASSPTDGAIVIVENFMEAMMDGTISADEQTRISGDDTRLGNPVDIVIDTAESQVIVAERANSGGIILAFSLTGGSGSNAPTGAIAFEGASAVFLEGTSTPFQLSSIADFFVSSNNSGLIGYNDVLEDRSGQLSTFSSQAMDADGIYYDDNADVLYQLNRTDNIIQAYGDVKMNLANGTAPPVVATSSSDFTDGREITVAGNLLVVAQDASDANGQANRLIVYKISPTAIVLESMLDVDINLWGIHADVNTLYAIVDNSNQLAVFDSFFLNKSGMVSPSKTIAIDDMIRTHGITYDAATDKMILTDVGDAMSSEDGAFTVIDDFAEASADNRISSSEQIRTEGPMSQLGNPVDIAYDADNKLIYVTERAGDGGKVLYFDTSAVSGDVEPFEVIPYPGASGIYLTGSTVPGNPSTSLVEIGGEIVEINVSPNPVSDWMKLDIAGEVDLPQGLQLQIVNGMGQIVKNLALTSKKMALYVGGLATGNYTVIINNGETVFQEKLIKL